MKIYPICLIGLERQKTVVIGGGSVSARKVEALLAAGARPLVISPELCPALQALAGRGEIDALDREYQDGDLDGAFLVVAATSDPVVNTAVWREASGRGCMVNVVDDPQHCNFILPAVVRRGAVTATISTGGGSPALARRLRQRLEEWLEPEWGELADLLAELRPAVQAAFPPGAPRQAAFQRLLDSDLLTVIQMQGVEAARDHAHALLKVGRFVG